MDYSENKTQRVKLTYVGRANYCRQCDKLYEDHCRDCAGCLDNHSVDCELD